VDGREIEIENESGSENVSENKDESRCGMKL
jgi:hypothetical protein